VVSRHQVFLGRFMKQSSDNRAFESLNGMPHCDYAFSDTGDDPKSWPTHPLTGEFLDRKSERNYLNASFKERLRRFIVIDLAAAVFFILGTVVDFVIGGPHHDTMTSIFTLRTTVTIVLLGCAYLAGRLEKYSVGFEWIVFFALTTISAGSCVLIPLVGGKVSLHIQTALVLVLLYYLFVPLRLVLLGLIAVVFSACQVASIMACFPIEEDTLAQLVFYLILINLLGALFARGQQGIKRREFAAHLSECRIANALRREIAVRETVEQALAEKEIRFRTLVELAPDAIIVHRHGRILYINPQGVLVAGGMEPSDIIGHSIYDFIRGEDLAPIVERINKLENGGRNLEPLELQTRTLDGKIVDCEIVSGPVVFAGEPAVQSIIRDITERKKMSRELLFLATTDSLTGIFNRRKFFEEMEKEWSRARRHSRPLSLIMFDIDYFKSVNDSFGHSVGDRVLCALVEKTTELLRSEDIFCRLGGEEFGILLPEVSLHGAEILAERIRRALKDVVTSTPDGTVSCTVSLGVAQCRPIGESMDHALKRADDALYEAKRAGRNRVEVA